MLISQPKFTKDLLNFIKQPLIKKSVIFFLIMFLSSLALLVIKWTKIPPRVPLYYSLPWGEKQLASSWELTILPTFAVSIFTTNLLISFFVIRENKLLVKILTFTGLFAAGLLIYSFIRIILLIS